MTGLSYPWDRESEKMRQDNLYALYRRGYDLYTHRWPEETPEEHEQRLNAKWENLKRYGHSEGYQPAKRQGTAADQPVPPGPGPASGPPQETQGPRPDTTGDGS